VTKILVIDDERQALELLDILLSQKGYSMILADNGWKGLELYRRERPDVIVLDLNMPGMSGVAVLKEIRRVDLKQPVIIFTGATTHELEQQVRTLWVTEIVEKDFTTNLLEEAIKRILAPPAPSISRDQI